MHAAAQRAVLLKLERLLAPEGILFLGPAEQALAIEFGFVPVNIPMAFACRRAPACVIPEPITVQQAQTSIAGLSPPRPAHRAQAVETKRSSSLMTIDA